MKIPWRRILSRIEVWTIIVSHFCHNWGTFILLTWMPTYYNQVLGLDLMKSGFFSVLPWITMAVAANVGGWIADGLVPKIGVTRVRKVMQTVSTPLSSRFTPGSLRCPADWILGSSAVSDAVRQSAFRSSGSCMHDVCTRPRCLQSIWTLLQPPRHRSKIRRRPARYDFSCAS